MVHFDEGWPRRRLTGHLLWFGGWLFVTLVGLLFLVPSPKGHGTHTQLGLPPCPSVLFYQRPCPGCGLTTSFTALIHGDFAAAFRAHPFGPIFYFAWAATAIACLYGFIARRRFNTDGKAWNRTLGVLVAAFFVYGMVRLAGTKMDSPWEEDRTSAASARARD